ncbi:MAG: hypothetical protein HY721_13230 [Planctomycetes bacterium]|nr:hypothetical protein [Planctomycetota bacterium]
MAQQEDVLFCKIAISNGLVSERDAQKALALCEKREREEGKRPQIGSVFTKYNLMKAQEVQRIYDAVRKRSGGTGAAPARGPGGRPRPAGGVRGARPRPGQASARASRDPEGARPRGGIDQQTMVMGIGGILALVVIVGVILYIVFSQRGAPDEKKGRPRVSDTEAAAAAEKLAASSSAKPGASPKAPVGPKVPPAPQVREAPKDYMNDLKAVIADARKDKVDDPQRGLDALDKWAKDFDKMGYTKPRDLLDALAELREAVGKAAKPAESGGSAEPAPPAESAAGSPAPVEKEAEKEP